MTCIYSSPTDSVDNTYCSNKLVPGIGIVPTDFCIACPWSIELDPSLTYEEQIAFNEQKRNETIKLNKICSNCGKQNNQAETMSITIRREAYSVKSVVGNPLYQEPKDADWAVVVTTSPRHNPTLIQCTESIKIAGWTPTVFAEPDSILIPNTRWVSNPVRLGAWHNWLKSIKWALTKTTASYILTVQDDSLFHPDSRQFVEAVMWPTHNTGFISLYTASHYSADRSGNIKPVGVNRIQTTSLWGACALVFSRDVLTKIITHPLTESWTGIPPSNLSDAEKEDLRRRKLESPHLIQNVDTALSRILNSLALEMYVVDPSPVQHIAVHSAINHGSNTGKRNCGRCADPNMSLFEQVFPKQIGLNKQLGNSSELLSVLEKEIGYKITCDACLTFIASLNNAPVSDIKDVVVQLYTYSNWPNEWRKKYVGKTYRLQRIEELIRPLLKEKK